MKNGDIFNNNLDRLRNRDPQLAEAIASAAASINLGAANCGDEISGAACSEFVNCISTSAIYVVIGSANIASIQKHLKEIKHRLKSLIIIEQSVASFTAQLMTNDLRTLIDMPGVMLAVGLSIERVEKLIVAEFGKRHLCGLLDFVSISVANSSADNESYCEKVIRLLSDSANMVQSAVKVDRFDTYHGLINVLDQYETFGSMKSIDGLEGFARGLPGILVGTGPSLNRRVDDLKNAHGKAIVLSVDSAFPVLSDAGVKPDFVAALERVDALEKYFDGNPLSHDVPLIAIPSVSPKVLRKYPAEKLLMVSQLPMIKRFFPHNKSFPMGLAVSHLGLMFLNFIGCSPIYLVGHDLSYDEESKYTHAAGMRIQGDKADPINLNREISVIGNDGVDRRAITSWNKYRSLMEQLIEENGIRCINVIEKNKGALIRGTELLEPDRFALPVVSGDIGEKIKKVIDSLAVVQINKNKIAETAMDLNNFATECERVLNRISKVVEIYAANRNALSQEQLSGLIAAIENAGDSLQRDEKNIFQSMLSPYLLQKSMEVARNNFSNSSSQSLGSVASQLDNLADWFSETAFWARQSSYSIQKRYLKNPV